MESFDLPDNLQTISILDTGGGEGSLNTSSTPERFSLVNNLQNSAPASVIFESLIELLISFYEVDIRKQKILFNAICAALYNSSVISTPSYKVPGLSSLRSQYQEKFAAMIHVTRKKLFHAPLLSLPLSHESIDELFFHYSRYVTEFEELEYIAKGGFGSVYRVRNKLDNHEYAIKKISLLYDRDLKLFEKISREVVYLAKLSHPNIVAYKTAWIEPIPPRKKSSSSSSPLFKVRDLSASSSGTIPPSNSHSIIFTNHENDDDDDDHLRVLRSAAKNKFWNHSSSSSSSDKACTAFKYDKLILSRDHSFSNCRKIGAMLYVQMQLCDDTLRAWLDERNTSSNNLAHWESINRTIFRQILCGVEHIHSKGIIHRDLKPRNIFISRQNLQVQIGDFGLAKQEIHENAVPPETPTSEHINVLSFKSRHTSGVGTQAYAAPEQLSNGFVDLKSDMYSLGIILFELYQRFSTAMERSLLITELRRDSRLPKEFIESFPTVAESIQQLTSITSSKRPLARNLLSGEFSIEKEKQRNLSEENKRLKIINCQLEEKVQNLQLEIERMKHLILK